MKAPLDSLLVAELRRGHETAFEQIYNQYARLMFRYVATRIDRREDCEEIVQDTFVWIWTNRERLPEILELRSYLYGMVKHKILNHIRSRLIRREYTRHFQIEARADNSTQEQSDLFDTALIMDRTIMRLPERCRQTFRLSRIENKSIQEIAAEMKISRRTVENYLTQATTQLRKKVSSFYSQTQKDK